MSQWIQTHFSKPITLELLAQQYHTSPSHLQRLFKRIQGRSPLEEVRFRRIEKAKELLTHTDLSVTDIGLEVGYTHTSYFITTFKRATGLTPTFYRKRFL
ncbi:AraC family transcriptional regulator [Mechercharimyces sp. CAU 1602]|uniref:AraC family transcriptional regulator n=1 Tax=Mechercharimyces sp. CAU 1602 TaxID=2973933 RepID=UPI002867C657|nr:AraC family transcriptional regulator [Mechercharimyces sp. CAU 1602]